MRDAVRLEPGSSRGRWRRVSPRRPAVWVRVEGRWRAGHVQVWYVRPDGSWVAWLQFGGDGVASSWGLFVFDGETMRRRDGDEPPG